MLFSTGVRSDVTLARQAGLEVQRGIVVDEHLQTSAADVFAAGDAAEFGGRVYGIVTAAVEQARAAGANMVAPRSVAYGGTLAATTLKVAGAELASLGECVVAVEGDTVLRRVGQGTYRKFVLRDGRLVGAILLNDKASVRPVSQAIERGLDVSAQAEHLLDDEFDWKSLLQ